MNARRARQLRAKYLLLSRHARILEIQGDAHGLAELLNQQLADSLALELKAGRNERVTVSAAALEACVARVFAARPAAQRLSARALADHLSRTEFPLSGERLRKRIAPLLEKLGHKRAATHGARHARSQPI